MAQPRASFFVVLSASQELHAILSTMSTIEAAPYAAGGAGGGAAACAVAEGPAILDMSRFRTLSQKSYNKGHPSSAPRALQHHQDASAKLYRSRLSERSNPTTRGIRGYQLLFSGAGYRRVQVGGRTTGMSSSRQESVADARAKSEAQAAKLAHSGKTMALLCLDRNASRAIKWAQFERFLAQLSSVLHFFFILLFIPLIFLAWTGRPFNMPAAGLIRNTWC